MSSQDRARVLMVAWVAPPVFSGAGKQAIRLARRLREQDREVVILSPDRTAWLPRRAFLNEVPVVRYPTRARTQRLEKAVLALGLVLHLLRHPRKYQVVHLHGSFFLLRVLRRLKRVLRFAVVYKSTMWQKDDALTIRNTAGSRVLLTVDRWVCISEQFLDGAAKAGVPLSRVALLPNAIDLDRYRPLPSEDRRAAREALGVRNSTPIWITVGAAIPRKRLDLLIESWSHLDEPRPLFLVVGPTEPAAGADVQYARHLEQLIAHLELGESIVLLGERDDVPQLLGAADGFVFASAQEGLPNAVVEALAAGLPVIATRFDSADDLMALAGERLRLVDGGAASLARAVAESRLSPGPVPAGIRELDLNVAVRRYQALYDEIA